MLFNPVHKIEFFEKNCITKLVTITNIRKTYMYAVK